jgi:hypothetical protein
LACVGYRFARTQGVFQIWEIHVMKNANVTRVQTQLALTAAALAGSAMGFEQTASAAINTTFAGANITIPATLAGIYINLATGATGTSAFGGWDFNPYLTSSGLGFYWGTDLAGGLRGGAVETAALSNLAADLSFGTVVGPSSTFTSAIQSASANYRDTGVSYLGFRFVNGTTMNYGYAAIQTSAANGFPATLLGWVFEDSGAPITVQAIPAPGAASLLGLLAAGATTRRSRRAA